VCGTAAREGGLATSITAPASPQRPRKPFPARHPGDYNFFLVYVLLIWLFVLGGFVPDMIHHARSKAAPYLVIGYVHAVTAVGWLALLTTQTLLIRSRRVRWHRKIGVGGAVFAAALAIIGIATALAVHRADLGVPHTLPPAFLSIQLTDMLAFACLAGAAISARNEPSAHKRLILLATLALTPPAISRWLLPFGIGSSVGVSLHALGHGVWQGYLGTYAATDLMVAGIGAYDWATRRRIHPAWMIGAVFLVTAHIAATWLYLSPGWKPVATAMARSWPW
jgi:hypothetical protein